MSVPTGEPITLDAPLGTGSQLDRSSTHSDLLTLTLEDDLLVGPIYVEGAEPSDVLAVDIVEVVPHDFGFTVVFPGFGFLSDLFFAPYLVTWELSEGHARSDVLPGVRVRGSPFPGTIGVAPSPTLVNRARERENALASREGLDLSEFLPLPVPTHASDGLGTLPPREFGGNLDVRQLTVGSRVFFKVRVPGALFSFGDMHFAQGEGEICGSAIEMGARVTFRFEVLKSPPWTPRFPAFETAMATPRRYFATTGISLADDGTNQLMDVGLAARQAVLEMIDYLTTAYGFEREAAYVLTSVAGELRISQLVDLPNALVSLLLPVDVFENYRSLA